MTVATENAPAVPRDTRDDYAALLIEGVPLIDVRAPVEFAKGAFPSSVNLPLMSDEERHRVGIRYKEAGQNEAIALGTELVDGVPRVERTQAWRDYAEAHQGGALYCFRGGLRSRISQGWLSEAGIEWPLVTGGYKALRSFVLDSLERLCRDLPLVLIGGRTGTGKTELLLKLDRQVDLEGRANHRGSSFGGMGNDQPTPINFENNIAIDLLRLEHRGGLEPVWMEDEARLIGRLCVPDPLREAMLRAPAVILETPMELRVATCTRDYVTDLLGRYQQNLGEQAGFDAFADHHRGSLDRIRKRFGGARHKAASVLLERALQVHRLHADVSGYAPFIEMLLAHYYDPMYDYQMTSKDRTMLIAGDADTLLAFAAEQGVVESSVTSAS